MSYTYHADMRFGIIRDEETQSRAYVTEVVGCQRCRFLRSKTWNI